MSNAIQPELPVAKDLGFCKLPIADIHNQVQKFAPFVRDSVALGYYSPCIEINVIKHFMVGLVISGQLDYRGYGVSGWCTKPC